MSTLQTYVCNNCPPSGSQPSKNWYRGVAHLAVSWRGTGIEGSEREAMGWQLAGGELVSVALWTIVHGDAGIAGTKKPPCGGLVGQLKEDGEGAVWVEANRMDLIKMARRFGYNLAFT